MSHNAIRVSICNSCNIWLFLSSAILRISKEGKRPNIEVLNLNKVMLHRVIYGHYCMEGREEFTLMCKFSPKSVVHLCINRISHFGVTLFSSFMILLKKPNVVHIIYLSSINMQFTKLQVRPLQVNQNWHTHRLNYLQSHKMDFVV